METSSPRFGVHGGQVDELDQADVPGGDLGLLRGPGRAADVEGPHGQLGARLADGLGGDNADGFADLHQLAVGPGPGRSI